MSYQSATPVMFSGGVSMVTNSLGANDPEIGTRTTVDGREYVFVYNGGGSTIAVGYGAVPNSAATNMTVTVSAATSADCVVGVCRNAAIADGYYGWLVTKGVTPVFVTGAVTVRNLIEVGANAHFAVTSNTTGNKAPSIGIALETASSALTSAYISCY